MLGDVACEITDRFYWVLSTFIKFYAIALHFLRVDCFFMCRPKFDLGNIVKVFV